MFVCLFAAVNNARIIECLSKEKGALVGGGWRRRRKGEKIDFVMAATYSREGEEEGCVCCCTNVVGRGGGGGGISQTRRKQGCFSRLLHGASCVRISGVIRRRRRGHTNREKVGETHQELDLLWRKQFFVASSGDTCV